METFIAYNSLQHFRNRKDNFEDYDMRNTKTWSNNTNIPVKNTVTNPGTPMENNVTVKQVETAWTFFGVLFLILWLSLEKYHLLNTV